MFRMSQKITNMLAVGTVLAMSAFVPLPALSQEKPIVIGLAMPFQTNGWQKAFLQSAEWAQAELAGQGKKIELKVVDAAGDVQTQIQQVNNLTLEGVDYILLEPLSDTALNGAIDNALDAGIPVMTVALGPVTNKRPPDLVTDLTETFRAQVDYLAGRVNGKGKALNIRGLAGNAAEKTINDATIAAMAQHPGIEIVNEIYGDWNQTTAQQRVTAILPSLPEIDVVLCQGDAAFGAAQAFIAAGRKVPVMIFALSGTDMNMLRKLNTETGYDSRVMQADPGIGGIAVNAAVAALSGTKLPNRMTAPFANFSVDDVKRLYPEIADNSSGYGKYEYQWTLDNVIATGK